MIQGIQNEGQVSDTVTASFEIFQLLIETRKATGFKFLRENCWEINQVTSKCQMHFSNKISKKGLKHHHRILHIRNSLGTKFQLKLTI